MTRTTLTTTAGDLPRHVPIRLLAVEGIQFEDPLQRPHGLSVEQVMFHPDPDIGDEHAPSVAALSVWHDRGWMFGIHLQPDDEVTWSIDDNDITPEIANLPSPPSRDGQVRVHGTWKQRGEVDWAPSGHPFYMDEHGRVPR